MKIFIILPMLMIYITSYSQDCKGVRTVKDEMAGTSKTESPTTFMGPKIQAVKIVKDQKESSFIYFSLTWPVKNYEAKGILIKLSDSTFIRLENAKVDCSYLPATGSYQYSGTLLMSEDLIERLSKNKILVFRVGEGQNTVGDKFASKFMDYIKCIFLNK